MHGHKAVTTSLCSSQADVTVEFVTSCGAELPQKHWTAKHLQSGLAQVSTTAYQTDSCDDVVLTDAVHLIFMGSSSGWQRGTS